jgi:SAM-dependent methyltransferase
MLEPQTPMHALEEPSETAEDDDALGRILSVLRCPRTGRRLARAGDHLVPEGGGEAYRIDGGRIPLFAERPSTEDSSRQQMHYDRVAVAYVANLGYPHTRVYGAYLDDAVRQAAGDGGLGLTLEVCCGNGEAFGLLGDRIRTGIGVDISSAMLARADAHCDPARVAFVQGDATRLPIAEGCADTVVMLGGIHHVNDRRALFGEIARVLRPGGRFIFREPLDDFWLWRAIRKVIYTLSPALDEKTERPLRTSETVPVLERAGLSLESWRSFGFLGFCFFMNSDVLVFNRLFRFVPGIEAITRAAVWLDERTRRLPGLAGSGLQVVGTARKPAAPTADRTAAS